MSSQSTTANKKSGDAFTTVFVMLPPGACALLDALAEENILGHDRESVARFLLIAQLQQMKPCKSKEGAHGR